MLSGERTREVSWARMAGMCACRRYTKCSLPQIARAWQLADHTSVMYAARKAPEYAAYYRGKSYGKKFDALMVALDGDIEDGLDDPHWGGRRKPLKTLPR